MKLECCHADTCLPDYWSGHHLPHVQIPVWPGMSLKEIKSLIRSEIAMGAVAGSTEDACLLSWDAVPPEKEKYADRLTRAVYAAVNRMKPARKGQRKFFTDVPEMDEDGDCQVYAFFVFVEI
jgi:hypothetical protein